MGKGWAKGLTAKTDARVARMAEGHRGKLYVRRTPLGRLGWLVRTATTLPLAWSDPMAYIVGLTATDGCRAPYTTPGTRPLRRTRRASFLPREASSRTVASTTLLGAEVAVAMIPRVPSY